MKILEAFIAQQQCKCNLIATCAHVGTGWEDAVVKRMEFCQVQLVACSKLDMQPYNHTKTHMRMMLKAVAENALRREIHPASDIANSDPEKFEIGPMGFLVLKRKPDEKLSLQTLKNLQSGIDDEDFLRAIHPHATASRHFFQSTLSHDGWATCPATNSEQTT